VPTSSYKRLLIYALLGLVAFAVARLAARPSVSADVSFVSSGVFEDTRGTKSRLELVEWKSDQANAPVDQNEDPTGGTFEVKHGIYGTKTGLQ